MTTQSKNKIYSLQNLKKILAVHKKKGKKIVFTNGCFDILHIGHLKYLKNASKLGDILVIGLNSDSSVKKIKPKRPLVNEKERAYALSCIEFIDYIVLFKEDTPKRLISELIPDILVKGADYKIKDIVGADVVKSHGGKVKRIPLIKNRSTTGLIKTIVERFKND